MVLFGLEIYVPLIKEICRKMSLVHDYLGENTVFHQQISFCSKHFNCFLGGQCWYNIDKHFLLSLLNET